MANTSTDWRTLCAELVAGIDNYDFDLSSTQQDYSVLERARAALAQPEPDGPTDDELTELARATDLVYYAGNGRFFNPFDEYTSIKTQVLAFARAVLTRWGRHAIEPVPVSERLPGPEDCDEEGQCWWHHPETFNCVASWCHSRGNGTERHWLPHHALPVPAPSSEEN